MCLLLILSNKLDLNQETHFTIYRQVPDQQFSAPFKAWNSKQVQTCYKTKVQRQRKVQHFLVYSSTGETGVLMTLNHWASMQKCSPLCVQTFSLLAMHKLLHFVLAEWNNDVITLRYFQPVVSELGPDVSEALNRYRREQGIGPQARMSSDFMTDRIVLLFPASLAEFAKQFEEERQVCSCKC